MSWTDLIPAKARWPLVIFGIGAATAGGLWRLDARAAEVAKTTTEATVNKAMVDGARSAAADSVKQAIKEQLPAIADEVSKKTAEAIVAAQRKYDEEKAKKKPLPPGK